MEALTVVLLLAGILVMGITGIVLLVRAFQTSVWWGLGYMFVPFVGLIFVVMYWSDTKKPFLYMLGGLALLMTGMALGGEMAGAAN